MKKKPHEVLWPSHAILEHLQNPGPKVYVAGPYSPSGNNPTTMLDNMRRGIRMAARLLMIGYIPFCPFLDFMLWMTLKDGEKITKLQIQAYSLAWLRDCQAVLLLQGWHRSAGCLDEIAEAQRLGIPVFTSLKELREHFEMTRITSKRAKPKRS